MAQLFLVRSSELISTTGEQNDKEEMEQLQGSEEGSSFLKEKKKVTMLGNLISLACPDKGTSYANWILDSGASRHVTGAPNEFASYTAYPSTYSETIQTVDGTHQPIRGVGSVNALHQLHYHQFCMSPPFRLIYYH
jgi:hypothetical protein